MPIAVTGIRLANAIPGGSYRVVSAAIVAPDTMLGAAGRMAAIITGVLLG